MSKNDAYIVVDNLKHSGIREIDLLGGEPTLIPWIKDFIRYVTDLDITLNVSTNGSVTSVLKELASIPTSLLNIGFSIHGFAETHNELTVADNFHVAIEGITEAISGGKDPIVKSVLTKKNRQEIGDLVLYLRELGVKRYFLLHEDIIGRKQPLNWLSFPEFHKYFLRLKADLQGILDIGCVSASGFFNYGELARGRCDAGIKKLAILPDGSVFPCNLFFRFEEFYLGNILEDGIETVWHHPLLEQFRQFNRNECPFENCPHYSSCSGGCPAHSYSFYRSLGAPDPRCNTWRV